MSDRKSSPQDPAQANVPANQPSEQRGYEKKGEGQANTTGVQPGMSQQNDPGRHSVNDDRHEATEDPNPGPGITTQGHRVDEETPAQSDAQDSDRKQSGAKHDMPSSDQPRDQDKDRKDPMDEHEAGRKQDQAKQGRH